MFGIIGGSGFEKFDEFETVELLNRETPFGLASSGFKKVRVNGVEFLFISRHGEHHELLPTEINYRANIFALKNNGAKAIVSFSAIGSLEKVCKPGDLVVPYQYIDRTKGVRASTFLGDGLIGHVSLAKPICEMMAEKLKPLTAKQGFETHYAKTYVCIEGPYFSTKAESLSYRQMGAEVIGMSNFPEYALAREAGLPYLPCCFVTDYDCWDDNIPHVTVAEVINVMKGNNSKAFSLLKEILAQKDFWAGSLAPEGGLRAGLFMPKDAIPLDKRGWVQILMN
ncbi:MTAP family purine nucleoside phosphorylase [Bdellovibrio sp. HCB337]|uniref:MTAP family purine nucleoside phosphorylase n=1 Tax=Bdellovibrio sp. HCB337 TaxID=3394358 RepID=UPI0039A72178